MIDRDRGRLLVSCPDRPGIVAAVSRFLFERGANIVHSDQHSTDPTGGLFFLRVEFDLPGLSEHAGELRQGFTPIAATYAMEWRLALAAIPQRLAVFVSAEDHCLLELLWQHRAGDLRAEIAIVIGNHAAMADVVAPWGIPFHQGGVGVVIALVVGVLWGLAPGWGFYLALALGFGVAEGIAWASNAKRGSDLQLLALALVALGLVVSRVVLAQRLGIPWSAINQLSEPVVFYMRLRLIPDVLYALLPFLIAWVRFR